MVNELNIVKNDIKAAIESKGVTVSGGLSTYADAIREIGFSGNAGQYVIPSNMTLSHSYNLTPLYKYTIEKRTNCNHLFANGYFSDIKPIEDLFDTSEVTDMSYMFKWCESITVAPALNTSEVTDMKWMFYACSKLEDVPLYDTSNVTDMEHMFGGCDSLTAVPLFNTSNVTNMDSMFYNCPSLTTIPQFDTSNVTDMYNMFFRCYNLTSIPLLDMTKVGDVYGFFGTEYSGSTSTTGALLTKLTDLGGFKNLGAAFSSPSSDNLDEYGFLYRCPNLTHQSIMNVINNLYDFAAAGKSVYTIRLNPNTLSILTDDEIAIATNKGWILT